VVVRGRAAVCAQGQERKTPGNVFQADQLDK
jgi:hypothetical protein